MNFRIDLVKNIKKMNLSQKNVQGVRLNLYTVTLDGKKRHQLLKHRYNIYVILTRFI